MLLFCHFTRFPPPFPTCLFFLLFRTFQKWDEGSHTSFHGRTQSIFRPFLSVYWRSFLFFAAPIASLSDVWRKLCWSNEKRWLQFHVCTIIWRRDEKQPNEGRLLNIWVTLWEDTQNFKISLIFREIVDLNKKVVNPFEKSLPEQWMHVEFLVDFFVLCSGYA